MSVTETYKPQPLETNEITYNPQDAALYDSIGNVLKLSGIDMEGYLLDRAHENNKLRLVPRSREEAKGPSVEINENGSGSKRVKEVGLREGVSTYPGVSYAYVKLEDRKDEVSQERTIRFMNPHDILSHAMPVQEKIRETRYGHITSEEVRRYIEAEDAEFATSALKRFQEKANQ